MRKFLLLILVVFIPVSLMVSQTRKKPYGITTVTTPAGSNLAPIPSEQAFKHPFAIPVYRTGEFSLELQEYRQGIYVEDLLGDRIFGGAVKKGDRVDFTLFLDFKGMHTFQLFTYLGASMWYKKKETEKKFNYLQYEGSLSPEKSGGCSLFLIYEEDETEEWSKKLNKLLKDGKLPDKYTQDSEELKQLPRFFIIRYRN